MNVVELLQIKELWKSIIKRGQDFVENNVFVVVDPS